MNSIRWGGFLTFVVVTALVSAAMFFSGVILKPVLESKFTDMNGAKVDIKSINIAYSPFSLEINNIQIASPEEAMLNTAQVDQLSLVLSFGRMLMGQLVIEDASINGVRVDTPRTRSGLIIDDVQENESGSVSNEETLSVASFDFPDISELLDKESLQSEVLLDKLNKEISVIDDNWAATKSALPDSNKIDTYENRFNQIKKQAKGSKSDKITAIKEAKNLIAEIKNDASLIKKAKDQLSSDIDQINKSIKQVKAAPAKDIKQLKDKYSINSAGAENISKILFGDEVASYLVMAKKWYGRIAPYLSSNESQEEAVLERSKGLDIVFTEYEPRPGFYIEVASVSAELPRGQFQGEISQVSSDQSINKMPMHFNLHGVAMVNKKSESISAEFNYVNKDNSYTEIDYSIVDSQMSQLSLSRSSELPLVMKSALMSSTVNARLKDGVLKGMASTQFRQVNFETGRSSMFAAAFEGIRAFDINVRFSGAMEDLSVQIDSDLDNQLGKQLKRQLAKKNAEFEAELNARLQEKISAPMADIEAKKNELMAVKQRLSAVENQLNQQLKALKDVLNKEKDLKKGVVKGKLLKKLGF